MLYTAELTKSDGGPLKSLDATFIKADDLEEAKIAALKWAGEKATPSFGESSPAVAGVYSLIPINR
jgi:hypothetical protein